MNELCPPNQVLPVLNFGPLSVLPEYQRQGVGKALVQAMIEQAKRIDYGAILFFGRPEYFLLTVKMNELCPPTASEFALAWYGIFYISPYRFIRHMKFEHHLGAKMSEIIIVLCDLICKKPVFARDFTIHDFLTDQNTILFFNMFNPNRRYHQPFPRPRHSRPPL